MTPLVLALAGSVALVGAVLVLRSFGPGYRVGRLLASTPAVSIEDALDAAQTGDRRYVRVAGRIDSETDFEDEHHRPLVFRRRRFEILRRGRWVAVDDSRESVPFVVNEGLASIGIDADALDAGLVVIPREAVGTAGDAPDRAPPGVAADTPFRLRIEQVSSVEHAIVLGVPVADGAGEVRMTAGVGRPLVLTTLEQPEAMRILAGGRRGGPLLATILLALGGGLLAVALAWAVAGAIR